MAVKWIKQIKNGVEVFLYGAIGGGFFDEGVTAKDFVAEINKHKKADEIVMMIDSPGGNVLEGLTIYNALASHGAKITAHVQGLAGSIASVILQAADTRIIADNSFVMIHEPHGFGSGTAGDLRNLADVLEKTRDSILNSYVKRAGEIQRDTLSNHMEAETWYNASEALEIGLVDEVSDALDLAAHVDLTQLERFNYKNLPAEFSAKAPERDPYRGGTRHRIAMLEARQRLAQLGE